MTLRPVYELATDPEFRLLAGFTNPPKVGQVLQTLPSGQVEVQLDDAEGGVVTAWPLNGWTYADGAVVYIVFAANSADSGIVVGAKGAGYAHTRYPTVPAAPPPTAANLAQWATATALADSGIPASDVARLSQPQTFAAVQTLLAANAVRATGAFYPFTGAYPFVLAAGILGSPTALKLQLTATRTAGTQQARGLAVLAIMAGRAGSNTYRGASLLLLTSRYNTTWTLTAADLAGTLTKTVVANTATQFDYTFDLGVATLDELTYSLLLLTPTHPNLATLTGSLV